MKFAVGEDVSSNRKRYRPHVEASSYFAQLNEKLNPGVNMAPHSSRLICKTRALMSAMVYKYFSQLPGSCFLHHDKAHKDAEELLELIHEKSPVVFPKSMSSVHNVRREISSPSAPQHTHSFSMTRCKAQNENFMTWIGISDLKIGQQ